jgi:mRNA interferase YafQ
LDELLKLKQTTQFKKDLRRMAKRGADMDLLDEVILMLRKQERLPEKYRDHALTGDWAGYRDCHVLPDWLLIYMISDEELILTATRTGAHSDIFQK